MRPSGATGGTRGHPVCLLSAPGLRVQKTGKTWEKGNYPRACGRFCLSSPMWQRRTKSTARLRAVPLVIATIVAAMHRIIHALAGGSRMRQRRFAMKGESIACLRAILLVIANAKAAHRINRALAGRFYLLTPLRWRLTESTVRLQGSSRMRHRRFAMKGESIACLRAILLVNAIAVAAHRINRTLAGQFADEA